ncbi:MAG: ABC transporter substrate-binding protein [Albidovulum sp.]
MTTEHKQNGLSRRGLLKGATALGAAGLILPASMRPASAQAKKGGTLRVAITGGSTTDSLDPATWQELYVQVFGNARCNYLTEIAADGSLVGELAESWEASDDVATWRFKLRAGVTFHSGKSLTTEDVIASINHHRGEDTKSAAKPIVAPITNITAEGDTVIFTLEGGNADFPFIMSDYHLPILPVVDGTFDATTTDGTGAYIIDTWEAGVVAKLKRNPNYWKADRGHFDAVELYSILDSAARQNALITGEVDVVDKVDLNTVALLARTPGVKILPVTGSQHFVFAMDMRSGPFNDNNVRLALKYAIDRQEMVDKILSGYGSVGNDHPIGPSDQFYAADLEQHAYDPDKAKFYMKEAGLDSLTVDLSVADAAFVGAVDSGVLYSETAAAAGITINVIREPNDGYWDNVWLKKPWCASYWGGRPTADQMFSTAYAPGAPWNETFFDNARFNELLLAARSEVDTEIRRGMYHEMQMICQKEGGTVTPMFASYVMAHADKVQTPEKVAANWGLDGFRCCERWWFA